MKTTIRMEKIKPLYQLEDRMPEKKILYFDIETTGFRRDIHMIYLIGVVHKIDNQAYEICQWFAEDESSEKDILTAFLDYVKQYDILVSFNGDQFDVPFILSRLKIHGLMLLDSFTSLDLYKTIKKYKKALKLINLKQKTIEAFLKTNREDACDGGELIDVYKAYHKKQDEQDYATLIKHNHDDICGLVMITDILSYTDAFTGKFDLATQDFITTSDKNTIFRCLSKRAFKTELMIHYKDIYIKLRDHQILFLVPHFTGELKYFYENYKDYYYLPQEDEAIHKSVAVYVDKEFRKKATRQNCYTKKQSVFLPQFCLEFNPTFKMDYQDKMTFFEQTMIFTEPVDQILMYLKNLIREVSINQ